jgi:hypothetical protein
VGDATKSNGMPEFTGNEGWSGGGQLVRSQSSAGRDPEMALGGSAGAVRQLRVRLHTSTMLFTTVACTRALTTLVGRGPTGAQHQTCAKDVANVHARGNVRHARLIAHLSPMHPEEAPTPIVTLHHLLQLCRAHRG